VVPPLPLVPVSSSGRPLALVVSGPYLSSLSLLGGSGVGVFSSLTPPQLLPPLVVGGGT
jgi:hypothetical protein